jgi:hypothetical protein
LPYFVEVEPLAYLHHGILSYGFCRVWCGHRRIDRVVGFSCKKSGSLPFVYGAVHVDRCGQPRQSYHPRARRSSMGLDATGSSALALRAG